MWIRRFLALALLLVVSTVADGSGDTLRVLVFTRTEGFTHASILDGMTMFQEVADIEGWLVDFTDDNTDLNAANLTTYDVVVWLSTTGDVLDEAQEEAFQSWVESGGGYVGIHAAADCEYGWPWYGQLLGGDAWFLQHPAIQSATLDVEAFGQPGTEPWEARFDFLDEWYDFQNNPRPSVDVLLTLDPDSYGGHVMGEDHPIAWSHDVGDGRSFYTGLGHRSQTYVDPRFRTHVRDGVLWAAGWLVFRDGFERQDLRSWSAAHQPLQGCLCAGDRGQSPNPAERPRV